MGAQSDDLRDELDSEMSTIVGSDYDDLNDAIKDGLFTAVGNALETLGYVVGGGGGTFSGTFTNGDGDTVTVVNGIITSVA